MRCELIEVDRRWQQNSSSGRTKWKHWMERFKFRLQQASARMNVAPSHSRADTPPSSEGQSSTAITSNSSSMREPDNNASSFIDLKWAFVVLTLSSWGVPVCDSAGLVCPQFLIFSKSVVSLNTASLLISYLAKFLSLYAVLSFLTCVTFADYSHLSNS